ncbi:hypothetical protein [Paenibacillus odorifer]|uniref:hypothetical protein n=1 Tax=Paenibacillus odorifer TaxID=189426 RepID=UPI00096D3F3B|nr:hypothetical protein [Paenibacillus odorifer]OMD12028.1 hypothetical protein BJP50_25305 [Paenibacillus odorifer]
MSNLVPAISNNIEVPTFIPSRALTRNGIRNRRSMLRGALWPIAKTTVALTAVFVRELLF